MSGKKNTEESAAAEGTESGTHRQEYGVVPPAGGYRRRPHKQRHHHHHKANGKNDSNEMLYMRPCKFVMKTGKRPVSIVIILYHL